MSEVNWGILSQPTPPSALQQGQSMLGDALDAIMERRQKEQLKRAEIEAANERARLEEEGKANQNAMANHHSQLAQEEAHRKNDADIANQERQRAHDDTMAANAAMEKAAPQMNQGNMAVAGPILAAGGIGVRGPDQRRASGVPVAPPEPAPVAPPAAPPMGAPPPEDMAFAPPGAMGPPPQNKLAPPPFMDPADAAAGPGPAPGPVPAQQGPAPGPAPGEPPPPTPGQVADTNKFLDGLAEQNDPTAPEGAYSLTMPGQTRPTYFDPAQVEGDKRKREQEIAAQYANRINPKDPYQVELLKRFAGYARDLPKDKVPELFEKYIQEEMNRKSKEQAAKNRPHGDNANQTFDNARADWSLFLNQKNYKGSLKADQQFRTMMSLSESDSPLAHTALMGAFVKMAQGGTGVLTDADIETFWKTAGSPTERTQDYLQKVMDGKMGAQKKADVRAAVNALWQEAKRNYDGMYTAATDLMGKYGSDGDRWVRSMFGKGLPDYEAKREASKPKPTAATGTPEEEAEMAKLGYGKAKP